MDDFSYMKSFSIIHRYSIIYHIKALKKFKISGHQIGYIMNVCKAPGVSQEGLSAALGLNKGAVAKGVRPLIEEGYIQRIQNESDRRAYKLYPTDKAEELLSVAEGAMDAFSLVLTKGMTGAERKSFKMLLTKACNNVLEAAGDDCDELKKPPGPPSECRGPHRHPGQRVKGRKTHRR